MTPQSAILGPVPLFGHVLIFGLKPGVDTRKALLALQSSRALGFSTVGIGTPLALALDARVTGLRPFPGMSGIGCAFPSTQGAIWISLGGDSRGDLLDRAAELHSLLGSGFRLEEEVTTFKYLKGHDLTGYEDGTENPKGDLAVAAAIVANQGDLLDGSAFVAVQRYIHDLVAFRANSPEACDMIIGRSLKTNEELAHAPASAHVKRAAQESYEPAAFMVRRSMPWGDVQESGLYFVAYGESLDRFERVLTRMAGLDDGVVDGLTTFTRAVSGGYYWCPPVRGDGLDLRALGIGT